MKTTSTILLATLATATAFTAPLPIRTTTTTSLNLLPEQGSQLAAAWEAANSHLPEEDLPLVHTDHHIHPTAAARSFVARIFSLPSTLLHPQEKDDVTYYPVVGFEFCANSNKPWPTTRFPNGASCRIPSTSGETYGWFSPACHLESFGSDEYCEDPKKN